MYLHTIREDIITKMMYEANIPEKNERPRKRSEGENIHDE